MLIGFGAPKMDHNDLIALLVDEDGFVIEFENENFVLISE